MTPATRPLIREFPHLSVDGSPLVVTLTPQGSIMLRRKGTQKTLSIPLLTVYDYARRAAGRERKQALRAARQARKIARVFDGLPDEPPFKPDEGMDP